MKQIWVLLFFFFFYSSMSAQKLVLVGKLIQGGVTDGQRLLDAYLLPVNRAMMVGMNNSGFNGVYDQEGRRFSLSLNLSLIAIPSADKTFNVNDLGLESIEPKKKNNSIAQTAFGDSSTVQLVSKYGLGNLRYFSINTLEGSGQNTLPLPYLNGAFYLKKGGIGIQVIPPVVLPKSDIKLWMVGASFYQNLDGILPFLEKLPFNLHLGGGVFLFRGNADLDVKPDDVKVNLPISNNTKGPYDNQELIIGYNGFYGTAYATMQLDVFTPFIGLGYNLGNATFDVNGTFPIYAKSQGSFVSVQARDIESPISSKEKYARLKLEVGGRFDFSRFFAQASYSFTPYGGLGSSVGIRF